MRSPRYTWGMEHADPSCKHIIIHFTVIKFWPVAGSHLHEFSTSTCSARTGGNGFLRRFARYLNDAIDPLVEQTLQLTQEAGILYNQVQGRTLVVIAAGHHVPKRDCFVLRFLGLFLGAAPTNSQRVLWPRPTKHWYDRDFFPSTDGRRRQRTRAAASAVD